MVELEILFSSGQGIVLPLEDRESALMFMKKTMDNQNEDAPGLCHFSTPYEEVLIDISDICFVRLKKENYPMLANPLKISAKSADGGSDPIPQGPVKTSTDEPIIMGSSSNKPPSQKPPEDKTKAAFDKAEQRLGEAEKHKSKLEAKLKAQAEAEEKAKMQEDDELKEAELKKNIEDIEISQEIDQMKRNNDA